MKIYNEEKTQILDNPDLKKGWLKQDKIVVKTIPATEEVQEQGHYETIAEYSNGGKDVEWIVDVKGVEYQPAREEVEDISVYVPYTEKELEERKKEELRFQRETKCFPIINRGKLWYDNLTQEQLVELNKWYNDWLNVTDTLVEPIKPKWIK